MADNILVTQGSGTTIAADDVGGVLHQRVKLSQGADGVAVDVSSAAPLQVTLANTGANATAVKTDGSATTQPISASSLPLPTLAATSTKQSDGSQKSQIVDGSGNVIGATSNALDVNIKSGASAGTQYADGAARGTATGTLLMVDDGTNVQSAVGTSSGVLKVDLSATTANSTAVKVDGSAVTQPVSGTVTANAGTGTMAVSNTVLSVVGGGTEATAQRVTIANDSTGVLSVDDNGGSLTVDGTVTANAGSGTFAVSMATNTPLGTVAHDSADSGAPIKVGGRASSAEITPVTTGDRADFITDLVGKQVVLPYANNENFVSGAITTAMTGTTSTSLVAAPAAGLRNYITTIIVSNSHATVGTDVIIQDGSGGTTLLTIPAAAVYGGAVINLPVPLRQPTTATAIYCANVTTGASTKVSAVGYKGY